MSQSNERNLRVRSKKIGELRARRARIALIVNCNNERINKKKSYRNRQRLEKNEINRKINERFVIMSIISQLS